LMKPSFCKHLIFEFKNLSKFYTRISNQFDLFVKVNINNKFMIIFKLANEMEPSKQHEKGAEKIPKVVNQFKKI